MALGFLATKEITLFLPEGVAARLAAALEQLREVASGDRLTALERLAHRLAGGELSGPPDLLRELIAVALDVAGEQIAGASTRLLRGEDTTAELRTLLSEASALVGLIERSSAAR